MSLKNSLGRTADDPCNVYCSEDDYVSTRELAVAVRRTLVARRFEGGAMSEADSAALTGWLEEWIEPSGELIQDAIDKAKVLREADPRDVPLRWPVTWESSILIPVPITVARRTAAIKELFGYAERGDRLADRIGAKKGAEHDEAQRPPPNGGAAIPWGFLAVGAGVTVAVGVGGFLLYRKVQKAAVGAKRPHKAGNPAVCAPGAYGELSAEQRAAFSPSAFGLPERRAYPMPDVSHARNAKARAAAQYRAGKLSRSDFERVARKADRIIAGCRRAS